jgi:hypothetical protein
VWDEVEMGEVDGGDDEGDEGIAAIVFGVGEDGDVGLDELHLCIVISAETHTHIETEGNWKSIVLETYQSHRQHPSPDH